MITFTSDRSLHQPRYKITLECGHFWFSDWIPGIDYYLWCHDCRLYRRVKFVTTTNVSGWFAEQRKIG